jgi:hypothetical protein
MLALSQIPKVPTVVTARADIWWTVGGTFKKVFANVLDYNSSLRNGGDSKEALRCVSVQRLSRICEYT